MKVKTISVKRIKNLGNYQSETLEAFAELDEFDNEEEKILELRKLVEDTLHKPLNNNQLQDDF